MNKRTNFRETVYVNGMTLELIPDNRNKNVCYKCALENNRELCHANLEGERDKDKIYNIINKECSSGDYHYKEVIKEIDKKNRIELNI